MVKHSHEKERFKEQIAGQKVEQPYSPEEHIRIIREQNLRQFNENDGKVVLVVFMMIVLHWLMFDVLAHIPIEMLGELLAWFALVFALMVYGATHG